VQVASDLETRLWKANIHVLATSAWGLAACGHKPQPRFVEEFLGASIGKLSHMDAQDGVNMVQASHHITTDQRRAASRLLGTDRRGGSSWDVGMLLLHLHCLQRLVAASWLSLPDSAHAAGLRCCAPASCLCVGVFHMLQALATWGYRPAQGSKGQQLWLKWFERFCCAIDKRVLHPKHVSWEGCGAVCA
jgi:hypothetical protein